jgi:hypothetical protein
MKRLSYEKKKPQELEKEVDPAKEQGGDRGSLGSSAKGQQDVTDE